MFTDPLTDLTYASEQDWLKSMSMLAPAENGNTIVYWWAKPERSTASVSPFFASFTEAEDWGASNLSDADRNATVCLMSNEGTN